MSKTDTIKDLKEKIKRCLKDLFEKKLEHKNAEKFTFGTIRIFNLIYGMKKRKREILKLIYSYNDNMKRYNISGKCVENENTLIDVKYSYRYFLLLFLNFFCLKFYFFNFFIGFRIRPGGFDYC